MDNMTYNNRRRASDTIAGRRMSGVNGSHDLYKWHSVAHSVTTSRNRFWITLALTAPAVFYSADVQQWLGFTAPSFSGSKFIPAILGLAVFLYGGWAFMREAVNEIMERKPGAMIVVSVALTVALVISLGGTFGLFGVDIWWELTSAITIVLLCRWLEMRAVSQAWAICASRFGNEADLSRERPAPATRLPGHQYRVGVSSMRDGRPKAFSI